MKTSYFECYNYDGEIGVLYWPPAGQEYLTFSHRIFEWGYFDQ